MTQGMTSPIAILGGTGAEGLGLARRWAQAGERVILGSREAERARAAAARLTAALSGIGVVAGMDNSSAAAAAETVVLTVPFAAQANVLKSVREHLRPGTVLIDTTVPLAVAVGGRATRTLGVWQGSAAQQAAELAPAGVAVAAAFQNISAGLLASDEAVDADVIVCADDERARQVASQLAEKIPGVRAVHGGRLENARFVEGLTALILTLNGQYKVKSAGVRITGLPQVPAHP